MTGDSSNERRGRSPVERSAGLRAEVVAYDDQPDECTLFPRDAEVSELLTAWITAHEGSYVEPGEYR